VPVALRSSRRLHELQPWRTVQPLRQCQLRTRIRMGADGAGAWLGDQPR
jgi:hypothetical protein